jgi:hypothetical protein
MNYVDAYGDAAHALGVTLRGPVTVELPGGDKLSADMIVESFGAPNGTLVFSSTSEAQPHFGVLSDLGYTVSSFAEPTSRAEINDLRDVLTDWGWCGSDALRPDWA